jgi:hypothetical protein
LEIKTTKLVSDSDLKLSEIPIETLDDLKTIFKYRKKETRTFDEVVRDIDWWHGIIIDFILSEKFIRDYYISSLNGIFAWTNDFVKLLTAYQKMSETLLEDILNKSYTSVYGIPTVSVMSRKLMWLYISERQDISPEFMLKYESNLDWNKLAVRPYTPEKMITRNNMLIHDDTWKFILEERILSLEFIEKNWQYLNNSILLEYQNVSEKLIREHIDEFNDFDWYYIKTCQKISDEFKLEFADQLFKEYE